MNTVLAWLDTAVFLDSCLRGNDDMLTAPQVLVRAVTMLELLP